MGQGGRLGKVDKRYEVWLICVKRCSSVVVGKDAIVRDFRGIGRIG
jgi:hypothetical protein